MCDQVAYIVNCFVVCSWTCPLTWILSVVQLQAGYNSGYSDFYYELPSAMTDQVLILANTTNVGVTGRWGFRTGEKQTVLGCYIGGRTHFDRFLSGSKIFVCELSIHWRRHIIQKEILSRLSSVLLFSCCFKGCARLSYSFIYFILIW